MVYLYNLGICVYLTLVYIVSPFNKKANLWLTGRKKWQKQIADIVNPESEKIWVHCSSLGEFEQGRPLIEAIKEKYPTLQIVLTFFSPSGYEVRKNYKGADYVFYLPLDTKRNACKFIELINPKLVVFVKYEFWYHYLTNLKRRAIPTFIISANFRADQAFFKSYGKWYRKFLENFNHFFVQNGTSLNLLKSIGFSNATISGDTRFDRVAKIASEAKALPLIEQFCGNSKVIVAGSTWPKDEELLIEYFTQNPEKAKLIIVPHEVDPAHIQGIQRKISTSSILYSNLQTATNNNANILIVDTIGLLSSIYRYGHIAYIGGGFGAGIHNTLEAATHGLPVIFGPNYHKFQEARDLIAQKAAFSINTQRELSDFLNSLLSNEQERTEMGLNSKKFVLSGVGATDRILSHLHQLI